jgi:two-component system, chemotaxis family, sensor kinase CheA
LRLRGRLLPVVRLRDVVGTDLPAKDEADQAQNIMVVETGTMQYGLVVDSPPDAEEVVVKPLGRHLKGRTEYAGCTILGDGRVAMILDVAGVAAASQLKARDGVEAKHAAADTEAVASEECTELVLFKNHPEETFAVPLGLVGRIQRVPRQELVAIAGGLVHSTKERAMPLLRLEERIQARPCEAGGDRVSILVLRIAGEELGLIVPRVEDIRSLAVAIDTRTLAEPGVLGSFQLQDRTVRLLDVDTMARTALPQLFASNQAPDGAAPRAAGPPKVLFAEDSGFFRSHVSRILQNAGFTVTAAEDGDLAWQQLQAGDADFDVVVTDIQMPNCDGLELTRRIRRSERWKELPVLALTSLSSEEDVAAGRTAGISDYRVKLDDSALIAAVWQLSGVKA